MAARTGLWNMPNKFFFLGLLAVILAVSAGMSPASAEFFGCHDKPGKVLASYAGSPSSYSDSRRYTHEFAAQTRPHITIRRSHPGSNAKRLCRSWLVKEYRISGPVIVPQMRCWWE
jgi:hypothetical protein